MENKKAILVEDFIAAIRDNPYIDGKHFSLVKRVVESLPDAGGAVHGEWLYDSGSERYFCSACNEYALSTTIAEQVDDYDWEENLVSHLEFTTKEFLTDCCPHCGAKMDGDGNA